MFLKSGKKHKIRILEHGLGVVMAVMANDNDNDNDDDVLTYNVQLYRWQPSTTLTLKPK